MKSLLALAILVGTPNGWDMIENAQQVKVMRTVSGVTTFPFVPIAELTANTVVQSCDAVLELRTFVSCPDSGRTERGDVWRRWSDIQPTATPPSSALGAVRVRFREPPPIRFQDDESQVPEGLPIYLRIYEKKTGETEALIASIPWAPEVSVVRSYPQDETRCYAGGLWVDEDSNGKIDFGENGSEESRTRNETCSMALPLPVDGPSRTPRAPAAPIIEALKPGETPPAP